jgi:hypothetical protein
MTQALYAHMNNKKIKNKKKPMLGGLTEDLCDSSRENENEDNHICSA